MEEWRPVPGYPYEVSDLGRVRRTEAIGGARVGRILKQKVHRDGYLCLTLCAGNVRRCPQVHSLVAAAFLGPRPHGKQVNHKDSDKQNNALANLEYVTPQENSRHAAANGKWPCQKGEHNGCATLTEEQVREIRSAYVPLKVTCRMLGERYGVTQSNIHAIVTRRSWNHLQSSLTTS